MLNCRIVGLSETEDLITYQQKITYQVFQITPLPAFIAYLEEPAFDLLT